ncbi:D-alanyl-D-alanine carboxypeptidase [Candidatus Bealeia paramacronuclearis]|uniref:D-alanyl-D-alanine carboxypeptidase n=1 Tax=Candidatus Bealeia paramacronuclearis TaxID=1921001 RepID=A0ABZ2C4R7_9PROT|nr:D-alanyl-D-alanine carboxypeptidase [Candidatus Bealeia paramacronuclearis]
MKKRRGAIYKVLSCLAFVSLSLVNFSLFGRQNAAIIIDAHSGEVIHQSNPDTLAHPASMTKMMTLYLVFKAIDAGKIKFDQQIKVSKHASVQAPCKLHLKPGSTLTVKQAVLGAITKSANDASVVLAEALGGSEAKFAEMMTKEAKRLGMSRTVFKNASGLPNKQQITTARDMARLGQALYRDFPHHFKLFKEKSFVYKGTRHANHNRLLERVKEIDGIKTGFINSSGFNLTASMVKHGKRLIAVVMGGQTARSRDDHMLKLLNTAFAKIGKGSGKDDKSQGKDYGDMDQLLASVSQDEMTQDAVLKKEGPELAGELPGFETLDQLLAHMDEDQAEFMLAKNEGPSRSLTPLKKAKVTQNIKKVSATSSSKKAAEKSTKKAKFKLVKSQTKKPVAKSTGKKKRKKRSV